MVLCVFFLFVTRSWFKKCKMQTYEHSPVLFVGDDGAPMEFYIRSCQKRSVIKALVEHGGGSVRYMEGRNIIRLVEPGCRVLKVPNGGLTVSVQFIWDCVEQNCLLDINKYAIKVVSLNTSDISDNDEETNFVKKRPLSPPYRQEEDITLLKIILSNKDNFKEGFIDTSYWDNVAKYKILNRTTNSIRNRANFLSQLTPREAVKFGLSEEDQKILRKLRDTNRQKCVLQEDYIIIEHVRNRIDRMRDINFYNTLKESKCIASTSRALRSRFLDHIVPNIELYDISQNLKMEIRKAANNPTSYKKASKESHREHLDDLNKLTTKNSPIAGTAQNSHTKNGLKRKHFTKNASKNHSFADGRGHSASNHKKEDSIFNHASFGLGKKSSKSSVLHDNKETLTETHKNTLESYYKSKDKVQCFDHNGDVDRHFLRECVYKKSFNKCDEHITLPSKSPVNCNFKTPAVVENAKDTPVPHSINNHFLQHFNHMDSVDREARYNNNPMKISNIHTTAEEILDTFDVNILEKCQNTRKSKRQDFQANDPALRLSSMISDVAEEHLDHVVLPSDSANCIPQSFKRTSVSVLPTDHYSSSSESENDVENPAQKENTLHLHEATSVLKNIENIISFCPWLEDVSLSALDVSNRFNKLKGAVYKSVLASQAEKILKKGALNTDDKTLLLKYLVCESEIPPQDASILISSYIDTKIRRKG